MNFSPFPAKWSSWWCGSEFPIRILVDSSASRLHASFVSILLDVPLPQFFIILHGIAGATDVSNFLRAFLMVSLNSVSSGSMKQIPRNFRAFSRWSFSLDHFCFSFSLACFPIDFQSSGHRWSGLDVSCFLVNLPPDHIYPSGGFSSNRVNCVKPLSKDLTSLETHRYSSNHRCAFPAWHPNSYV